MCYYQLWVGSGNASLNKGLENSIRNFWQQCQQMDIKLRPSNISDEYKDLTESS